LTNWHPFKIYNSNSEVQITVFSLLKLLTEHPNLLKFQKVAICSIFISQRAVKAWVIANALNFSLLILKKEFSWILVSKMLQRFAYFLKRLNIKIAKYIFSFDVDGQNYFFRQNSKKYVSFCEKMKKTFLVRQILFSECKNKW
jgi:hypothetical protein